jgi:hypothetical protein
MFYPLAGKGRTNYRIQLMNWKGEFTFGPMPGLPINSRRLTLPLD